MTLISALIAIELETVKKLILNNLQWNSTRSNPLGMGPSIVYDYILEHGMGTIRGEIEHIKTAEEISDLIHEIYDESIEEFLSNELDTLAYNRIKSQLENRR